MSIISSQYRSWLKGAFIRGFTVLFMFLLNAPFTGGGGGGAFIRRGRLKEGGVYKIIFIFRGAFIRGRR